MRPGRAVRRRDRSDHHGRSADGERLEDLAELVIFPPPTTWPPMSDGTGHPAIESELQEQLASSRRSSKLLEAQRLRMRTQYDLEMMQEMGFCNGIENYSRHIDGRSAGRAALHPARLLPRRLPDGARREPRGRAPAPRPVRGRPEPQGDPDRARVPAAVGGRQPAAAVRGVGGVVGQVVFLSATPGPYELQHLDHVVEQIVRPTGLIDPEIIVRPTKGQIDNLLEEISASSTTRAVSWSPR